MLRSFRSWMLPVQAKPEIFLRDMGPNHIMRVQFNAPAITEGKMKPKHSAALVSELDPCFIFSGLYMLSCRIGVHPYCCEWLHQRQTQLRTCILYWTTEVFFCAHGCSDSHHSEDTHVVLLLNLATHSVLIQSTWQHFREFFRKTTFLALSGCIMPFLSQLPFSGSL